MKPFNLLSIIILMLLSSSQLLALSSDERVKLAYKHGWSKEYALAIEEFQKVLQQDPEHLDALLGLASVHFWSGDLDSALYTVNQLLAKKSDFPEAISLRVNILQAQKTAAKRFRVGATYEYQHLNFTSDTQGFLVDLNYAQPKFGFIRAAYRRLLKYGMVSNEGAINLSWFAAEKTNLLLDVTFSPNQAVLPIQSYALEVDQKLPLGFVPFLKYRFSQYPVVKSNDILAGAYWYLPFDIILKAVYCPNVSVFSSDFKVNHSALVQVSYSPLEILTLMLGYSLDNESFDSGNPKIPIGSYTANHVFGSVRWQFLQGLGVSIASDYESRSNGFKIFSLNSGLFYAW